MSEKPIKWIVFRDYTLRRQIAFVLLVVIIMLYVLYGILFAYSTASWLELKIEPQDFEENQLDNETITMKGSVLIDNDHWYSVDIIDLSVNFTFKTDDKTKLVAEEIEKDIIPKREKTKIKFEIEWAYSDLELEDFLALNTTDYLDMELSISFIYFLNPISLELDLRVDMF